MPVPVGRWLLAKPDARWCWAAWKIPALNCFLPGVTFAGANMAIRPTGGGNPGILELPGARHVGALAKGQCSGCGHAARLLNDRLEMPEEAIRVGIVAARVPGRLQVMGSRPTVLVECCPQSGSRPKALAAELGSTGEKPSVAVFSALDGKDVAGIGRALKHCFSHWLVAPLSGSRGRSADDLAASLRHAAVTGRVDTLESVADALGQALELAGGGCDGRVVVFVHSGRWPRPGPYFKRSDRTSWTRY